MHRVHLEAPSGRMSRKSGATHVNSWSDPNDYDDEGEERSECSTTLDKATQKSPRI